MGSVELAQPIRLMGPQGGGGGFDWGAFTVSAFTDGAVLRNKVPPQPDQDLYSVGVSLAWTPSDLLSAQLTYGRALNAALLSGDNDIQDRGLSFRVTVHPLRMRR